MIVSYRTVYGPFSLKSIFKPPIFAQTTDNFLSGNR